MWTVDPNLAAAIEAVESIAVLQTAVAQWGADADDDDARQSRSCSFTAGTIRRMSASASLIAVPIE